MKKTKTLIEALRILANDIKSDDGVANACIWEAAQRLEEFSSKYEWNFNIEKCPNGYYKTFTRQNVIGGEFIKTRRFQPYYIWAASSDGVVTKSYIVEDGSRFSCFTEKEKPIAWMPFIKPDHPNKR